MLDPSGISSRWNDHSVRYPASSAARANELRCPGVAHAPDTGAPNPMSTVPTLIAPGDGQRMTARLDAPVPRRKLESTMESNPRAWIETLRRSRDRLAGVAEPLMPRLTEQSYCTDWSVAQVFSHLGSGAEIALMMLPGALGDAEPVSRDAFGPVWDKWNAKSPDEQAADALAIDEQQVSTLEALTDEQLAQ